MASASSPRWRWDVLSTLANCGPCHLRVAAPAPEASQAPEARRAAVARQLAAHRPEGRAPAARAQEGVSPPRPHQAREALSARAARVEPGAWGSAAARPAGEELAARQPRPPAQRQPPAFPAQASRVPVPDRPAGCPDVYLGWHVRGVRVLVPTVDAGGAGGSDGAATRPPDAPTATGGTTYAGSGERGLAHDSPVSQASKASFEPHDLAGASLYR